MRAGLTIGEVIVFVVLLALLVALLLPVLAKTREADHYHSHCRSRMRCLFQGVRMYLNNYDEFFPLAWHEGSGDGFGQVTYGRFLIQVVSDTSTDFHRAKTDAEKEEILDESIRFWSDEVHGRTRDYFSPPAVFRLPGPAEMSRPYDRHASMSDFMKPDAMPILADVNASIPQAEGEGETLTGIPGAFKDDWITVNGVSYDVFYGVARSKTDTSASRFDFRHEGRVHVVFIDGHSESIKETDTTRLRTVHENWNIDSEGAP
jgi:prepilin-type processing-associated H-X9-DG protein